MSAPILIRTFLPADYGAVLNLWQNAEGVEVAEGDDAETITAFLNRNPGLSRVAESGHEVVAGVLCGHDGRRGLIYHLAVRADYRGKGIGKTLVDECAAGLRASGIKRALILVAKDNASGRDFWEARGFEEISGAAAFGLDLV